MKEKIKKYWWVIIIILIVGGAFYWYEWRPSRIVKECEKYTEDQIKDTKTGEKTAEVYNFIYKICIRQNGLEK